MILNSPTISGSLTVTGNIIALGSITLSGSVASASYAATASFVALAQSASFATSASNATNAISASYANNLTVAGTLTAQTLVVQTITSSVLYSSGSNVFGNNVANTQVVTGSVNITGSLNTNNTLYVSSSNVGIGITNPQEILHISSSSPAIRIGGARTYLLQTVDTDGRFRIHDNTAGERFTISQSGSIGIGTTTPTNFGSSYTVLDVYNGTVGGYLLARSPNVTGQISVDNNTAMYVQTRTNHPVLFVTNNTERMRIASNGTITTSNAPSGDWGMIINNLNTGAGNSYGLKVIAGTNSSDISFGVVNAANTFYYLRLNGNGHIKLANFSTTFSGNYHQIQNDVSGDWICQFGQNNASPYGIVLSYFNAAPRSSGAEMLYLTDSSGVVMKVSSNGNLYNVNNSYNALSDIKLKENIIDATPKLDKLMRVRIVNFNLKTDPNTEQIGVIAQELQEVFPGLIEENYDRGLDNKLNGETTLGVKYSVFVPMLIKAIQELKSQNDALQSRIETLESK